MFWYMQTSSKLLVKKLSFGMTDKKVNKKAESQWNQKTKRIQVENGSKRNFEGTIEAT